MLPVQTHPGANATTTNRQGRGFEELHLDNNNNEGTLINENNNTLLTIKLPTVGMISMMIPSGFPLALSPLNQ